MVARSCTLLIFIALENTEARKDFQGLKKKLFLLLPSYVWGSLLCVWSVCLRGSAAQRGLLSEPKDRGGTRALRDHTQCDTSADLGFHFGALGFWGMFCLYIPGEFSLAAGLGLGICPGFCPRCQWHHLFSACCRFYCWLCIFELVLSVLYCTP